MKPMPRIYTFRLRTWSWDAVFTAGLYLSGLLLWGIFFNWGDIPYQFHDWSEVNMPRLASVQDALHKNELPLHVLDAAILRCGPGCDRYFSAVDVITSPQIILLKWMPLGPWVLTHILLLYTAGFCGIALLRRRFNLSIPFFALLFVLFFFNGHILSHLSVGHITWGGYFLFPWLVVLVDRFIRGDDSWTWVLQVALLLFLIYLQGSFHQFVWALIFLGFLSLAYIRRFLTVFKAMVFACLVSAFRLLPPVLAFNGFDRDFYGGYPSLFGVYEALTHWVPPADAMPFQHMGSNLGYWEFDLYISKFGLWFLVFAMLVWLIQQVRAKKIDLILLPIAALSLLAYDKIYLLFRQLPIPLLSGERVTARMISLPFIFFVVYALAALQKGTAILGKSKWIALPVAGLAAVYQAYILILRLLAWQVTASFRAFPPAFTNLSEKLVANHPDPLYITVLIGAASLSLISILFLSFLAYRFPAPQISAAQKQFKSGNTN
jgi:hypothetical protein